MNNRGRQKPGMAVHGQMQPTLSSHGWSCLAVARFGRAHNVRVADALRSFALERGLCREDLTLDAATLAVEVGDRVFQLAYENTPDGDAALVEEGITMMTAYLERYATDAGLAGVPA